MFLKYYTKKLSYEDELEEERLDSDEELLELLISVLDLEDVEELENGD